MPLPPAEMASVEGIVALGGELSVERLIEAYHKGIFPWFNADDPIIWWSPNPRMVLFPERLHISKNMQKYLRKKLFEVTYNQCFEQVIKQCASVKRKGQDDTWILPQMISAYVALHHLGYAHSVEVWQQNELVGGLYGVTLNQVFCGESMFSLKSNASQYGFITFIKDHPKIKLIDCQVYTEYLASMGAEEIPRSTFLNLLREYS
ncbi:leucyl/phenylalanyl-tRNA--protein transferase [Capnocytophaga canimorsus]|uniref:leucyl/phenylalanyl-tRNA--protein transferase n=1 Tax=Capnocytophaga canimorsus TaxID=28188 RepID=UPI001561C9B3|nr:leucyl/phenylalanyl-tRNA--protein transferase [Capnocytophaga canimorsus]